MLWFHAVGQSVSLSQVSLLTLLLVNKKTLPLKVMICKDHITLSIITIKQTWDKSFSSTFTYIFFLLKRILSTENSYMIFPQHQLKKYISKNWFYFLGQDCRDKIRSRVSMWMNLEVNRLEATVQGCLTLHYTIFLLNWITFSGLWELKEHIQRIDFVCKQNAWALPAFHLKRGSYILTVLVGQKSDKRSYRSLLLKVR